MKLYLQFGHGMMGHCRELIPNMPGSSVILSPRDLNERQIENLGQDINNLGGATLLDPQLYAPRCNHTKLTSHSYWPQNYSTNRMDYNLLLSKLKELNDKAETNAFILPGLYCQKVSDIWLNIHDDIIKAAEKYDCMKYGTLCLSADTLRFQGQLDTLLSKTEEWDVDGFYIIADHPNGEYLVDNPIWLANLMSFCAGIKLQGKQIILGYSNHQMLTCACAGVDAIASGTWMNVRSFTLDKFSNPNPDDIKRKRTWYYWPQALTEIKPEFLDIAFHRSQMNGAYYVPQALTTINAQSLKKTFGHSIINALIPWEKFNSSYANMLFSGAQPSTTNYNEPVSFRHYLSCLYSQCQEATKSSFEGTIEHHKKMLTDAEKLITFAHKYGIRGQKRDFEDYIDINLSAIDTFYADKGFLLKRMWSSLSKK